MLLASHGVQAGPPPDPVNPTDPDPDPGTNGWPTANDPTVTALRPAGRVVQAYRVGGTDSTHSTIGAASDAAQAAQSAAGRQTAVAWLGNPGPDYRCDILVAPGVRNEHLGWGGWNNLVGTGPGLTIREAGESQGVIHTFGSMHLENLTIESAVNGSNLSPKYALHITGAEQLTAVDVTFDVTDAVGSSNWSGGGVMGADFLDGSVGYFYGCTFRGESGQEGNLHGPADGSPVTQGLVMCFIDCTYEGGLSGPQFGGASPAAGSNSMYVIGGTMTQINAGTGTHVYTNLDVPVVGGGTVTRGVTSWPQPTTGLHPRWHAYYLPSSIGSEPVTYTPTVSDAATMTPVAGRTYVTRVKPPTAFHATSVRHTSSGGGGLYGVHINPADSTAPTVAPSLDWPNVAGQNTTDHYYFHTRYPGDDGFWVYQRFNGSVTGVVGSAQLAGVTDCYYIDGVALVPVTAGTPHPLPTLVAKS